MARSEQTTLKTIVVGVAIIIIAAIIIGIYGLLSVTELWERLKTTVVQAAAWLQSPITLPLWALALVAGLPLVFFALVRSRRDKRVEYLGLFWNIAPELLKIGNPSAVEIEHYIQGPFCVNCRRPLRKELPTDRDWMNDGQPFVTIENPCEACSSDVREIPDRQALRDIKGEVYRQHSASNV